VVAVITGGVAVARGITVTGKLGDEATSLGNDWLVLDRISVAEVVIGTRELPLIPSVGLGVPTAA